MAKAVKDIDLNKSKKTVETSTKSYESQKKQLATAIGKDVLKQNEEISTFAKYKEWINSEAVAPLEAEKQEETPALEVNQIPSDLWQQAEKFEKRLKLWVEDNKANSIYYNSFYPELKEFFGKLNQYKN